MTTKRKIFEGDANSPFFQALCDELDLWEDPVQGFICDDPSVWVYNHCGRINNKDFDHLVEVFVWD